MVGPFGRLHGLFVVRRSCFHGRRIAAGRRADRQHGNHPTIDLRSVSQSNNFLKIFPLNNVLTSMMNWWQFRRKMIIFATELQAACVQFIMSHTLAARLNFETLRIFRRALLAFDQRMVGQLKASHLRVWCWRKCHKNVTTRCRRITAPVCYRRPLNVFIGLTIFHRRIDNVSRQSEHIGPADDLGESCRLHRPTVAGCQLLGAAQKVDFLQQFLCGRHSRFHNR